ncbi:TM2 domain-containing protein [uncultured Desulfovibrio sp.]|uniref:TM2 domain-containing protein n=2 Tax=uncultured Desulfovibrio sp. TaxID=167968 RepID=UPI002631C824|nr:TM2 domain-containing protein [uncultured Desulfovibrio sp.]
MTKFCFSLLLLTALTGVLAKVDWSGVFPWLKPPSIMPFSFLLLLYIPPIVMALQEAAPCNDPELSLMAFGLNSWGLLYVTFDALLILAYAGCLALPCGLLLHAVVRAFRPGDRRLLLPLTLFAGIFGMHRFYAGRPLSGFYMLLLNFTGLLTVIFIIGLYPLSAVAIWMLIDLVFVAMGRFRDGQNHRITGRQDEGKDERNSRSRLMLTLLTIFLGVVGAHRFLVRRPYTGLCMVCLFLVNVHSLQCIPLMREATDFMWLLLTIPLQLSWLLSDIAAVRCGCFRDGRGRPATA